MRELQEEVVYLHWNYPRPKADSDAEEQVNVLQEEETTDETLLSTY